MPIKKYKPTTPGRRGMTSLSYEEITTDKPEKSLLEPLKVKVDVTTTDVSQPVIRVVDTREAYRVIDFKRNKDGVPAVVKTIEYDPNRSARIALLFYADGEKRYIIAPNGLQVGSTLMSGANAAPEIGNALPLENIPVGTVIHNIEIASGVKVQLLVRSAGNFCSVNFKRRQVLCD